MEDTMSTKGDKTATITVGTISLPVEVREIPIDTLRYYSSNPRIFTILKHFGDKVSQEQIESELWNLNSTKDLFQDIAKNGGLVEEILVRGVEVLEGNSRLCAYRHLLKKAKEKKDGDGIARWSQIRAKVLRSDVSEEAVFAILGILHIRGKAKWLPYEQASYLYRQSVDYRKTYRDLAEQIGVSESDVRNSVEAYKIMEQYHVTEPNRFSHYLQLVASRKLKEAAECLPPGQELVPLVVEWVESGQIPKAESVRDQLPIVLQDKKARTKFLKKEVSFEDAVEIAQDRHPETTSSFYRKLKKATEALNNAEEMLIRREIENDGDKQWVLKDLCRTVNKFCKAVGLSVPDVRVKKKRARP